MCVYKSIMTTIISWAKDERPREKLLKKGSNALSDADFSYFASHW